MKRRVLHFVQSCRRPTTLIGFAAVVFLLGILFRHRNSELFAALVRWESMCGAALIMVCGSLFKGFLERGLPFDPPDVDFLFNGPFTQRQIVFYRLLPGYLYAVIQSAVFLALFQQHLKFPMLTSIGVAFFQVCCFHLSAWAAIFGGSLSEATHYRLRWMLLGSYLLLITLYLRMVWGVKIIPAFLSSQLAQLLFYPAVTITDVGTSAAAKQWTVRLVGQGKFQEQLYWEPILWLILLVAGASFSLWLLLRLKANIFETSLATTARVAERRERVRRGRSLTIVEAGLQSVRLPELSMFRGAGSIIWKNLVVASRSRRALALAAGFTLVYTGFLVGLRWMMHDFMLQGGSLPARQVRDFDLALVGMMGFLAFLLQRAFPFDFRREGDHLVSLRTLPVSPLGLALAQITVPTVFCVAFQALGVLTLMIFARFEWFVLVPLLLGFPAVALALNGVWNLHYLLAGAKHAGRKARAASPVAMVLIVALSFLVFYPAGWVALQVGRNTFGPYSEMVAFAVWLVTQYLIDFLVLLVLAQLFQRFELSRDA